MAELKFGFEISSEKPRKILHGDLNKPWQALTSAEVNERSNLFQREFNQRDIHDRVLVVQVMPDDYEIQELEASLQQNTEYCDEKRSRINLRQGNAMTPTATSHIYNHMNNMNTFGCTQSPDGYKKGKEEDVIVRESGKDHNKITTPEFFEKESCLGINHIIRGGYKYETESGSKVFDSLSKNTGGDETESGSKVFDSVSKNTGGDETESKVFDSAPKNPGGGDAIFMKTNSNTCTSPGNQVCKAKRSNFETMSPLSSINSMETEEEHFVTLEALSHNYVNAEEIDDCETGNVSVGGVHVIKECRLYVHACYLAVNSPYFRSLLFESGMKECNSKVFHMKVTLSDETAFMTLIESIYDPNVLDDDVTINTLLNVIRLSVKYDVKFSMLKAMRVLNAKPLTLEVCEMIITGIATGGLPADIDDITRKVELFLVQEFKPLDETWESEKFVTISKAALQILLGSDSLVVGSENTVFVALMRWVTTHTEVYGDLPECSELLNLIRFCLMNPCYLHDVVRNHEVARQLKNFDTIYLAAITNHALPEKRQQSGGSYSKRLEWCFPKTPTYVWIVDTDEKMFDFKHGNPTNSQKSSSFWFLGYKMHLVFNVSKRQGDTHLALVVDNLSEDGSVNLSYNVDVKFSECLHMTYTSATSEYRGKQPGTGMYPFDETYSVEEIKELVLGGFVNVTIIFEISMENLIY